MPLYTLSNFILTTALSSANISCGNNILLTDKENKFQKISVSSPRIRVGLRPMAEKLLFAAKYGLVFVF